MIQEKFERVQEDEIEETSEAPMTTSHKQLSVEGEAEMNGYFPIRMSRD